MMKTMKRLLAGAAVAASLFSLAAPASATLTNWYVDTDGAAGPNAPVLVQDYLDLNGQSYIHNTFGTGGSFTFNEVGNFISNLADSHTSLAPPITASFTGSGSGTVGGTLTFSGGSLNVFSGLTNIGIFTLEQGSANLNGGTVLPNGDVSLIFKATYLASGYFFDSAMDDLSALLSQPGGLVFGFATTNAIPVNAANVSSVLVNDFNTAFDVGGPTTVAANSTTDLYVGNNGQFRLQVPEPSMLSLFGIALLGLGFITRRKFKV